MIDECDAILNSASNRLAKGKDGTNEASSLTATNLASLPGSTKDSWKMKGEEDDCDTVIYDYDQESRDEAEEPSCGASCPKASSLVECPLCGQFFPHYAIELHAGSCGEHPLPTAATYGIAMPIIID